MDMLQYLRKLFTYEGWANREALGSLRVAAAPPARSLKILAHIVAVDWLYFRRLSHSPQSTVVWPDFTLDQCEQEMVAIQKEWRCYLDRLTPADLDLPVYYVNSQGVSWQNAVRDMLMHVVLHSAYHRGQIAILLGAAGEKAAYTDFIHCVRQEFIS